MKLDFLPEKLQTAFSKINLDKLYEIRIKVNSPLVVFYDFKTYFLSENFLTLDKNSGILCTKEMIDGIIYNVTEYSIYSNNEKIKEGYITTSNGLRIGIAGECVFDKSSIITVKNFTSLVIRVPHSIIGCSDKLYDKIFKDKLYNTLIISPPRFGKTTILKDLLRNFEERRQNNILLIDERGELAVEKYIFVDVIKNSTKLYAFNYGIRSLSPEIVVTDELCSVSDWACARVAANSGIKIIASAHGASIKEIINKEYFIKNVFERYVILKSETKAGEIDKIFDGDLNELNC